jgi:hypothetical protein
MESPPYRDFFLSQTKSVELSEETSKVHGLVDKKTT